MHEEIFFYYRNIYIVQVNLISMDETQKQIYENFVRLSKKYGYEIIHGKKLSDEEKAEIKQHHQDICNFLKALDEFENNSRNITRCFVRVGNLETTAA